MRKAAAIRCLLRLAGACIMGVACAALVSAARAPQTLALHSGLVIERSARITPGVYALSSDEESGNSGVITIRGDNLTVDFVGAELRGTPLETLPDARKGTGIYVEGRNITLKNLHVRGYKIGLIARKCPGLKILASDFSYNWKQHLGSTLEREDLADWMSYHHNEKEEWLRYGAGVYLQDCDRFEVRGVTIRGGQCGLMLTRCNQGLIWNNDFSFLSGLGIGPDEPSDFEIGRQDRFGSFVGKM